MGTDDSEGLRKGLSMQLRDTMIAATAAVRGWTVATRNTTDFAALAVQVFDPWTQTL